MWVYEKKLQFPVQIEHPDPSFAKIVITQIGGPDGELSASMRYLNQRYAMPYDRVKAMLTDIGTEELAHLEMVSAIVYQLTKPVLMLTMSIIQPVSGHKQLVVLHLLQLTSNQKVTLSQT